MAASDRIQYKSKIFLSSIYGPLPAGVVFHPNTQQKERIRHIKNRITKFFSKKKAPGKFPEAKISLYDFYKTFFRKEQIIRTGQY